MNKNNGEEFEEDQSEEKKESKLPSLGTSAPSKTSKQNPLAIVLDPSITSDYLNKVRATLSAAGTRREILEQEVSGLAECLGLAMEIYKEHPFPDFAVPVTSLTNAHTNALAQLEKMKDPKEILLQIEVLVRNMFTSIVKALLLEIHKAKTSLIKIHPEDSITIEDVFKHIIDAIQPETSTIYQNLDESLRNILGIKK